MNKKTNLILLLYSSLLLNQASGDMQLKDMYCPVNIGSKNIENYIDYILGESLNVNEHANASSDNSKKMTMRRLIFDELGKFPGALSLHESSDGSRSFGLFFNAQLHGKFPPFFRVFGGGGNKIEGDLRKQSVLLGGNINFVDEYRAAIMNQVQLKVLDLNDAYVEIDDLSAVSRVESLRFLAMSSRGMRYDKSFAFPENITHLVVRSAELTPQFFQAVKAIKNLEHLEIDRCYIRKNYDWPTPADRNHMLDPSINNPEKNNPFENITNNLRVLIITQSDPALFEHFNVLAWPKLINLSVDIFLDAEFFRMNLRKNSQEFRRQFPVLKRVNLSLCDTKLSENLNNLIQEHEIKGLSFQIQVPRKSEDAQNGAK